MITSIICRDLLPRGVPRRAAQSMAPSQRLFHIKKLCFIIDPYGMATWHATARVERTMGQAFSARGNVPPATYFTVFLCKSWTATRLTPPWPALRPRTVSATRAAQAPVPPAETSVRPP